ncbi:MAG TPA: efflux RND transporter periplasmic adaptor subunit [Candidatus Binataceae bacterium]|nr:efflux RND transporter periplasmic adaptor subunit [Candidatus Binataceae bacterium]
MRRIKFASVIAAAFAAGAVLIAPPRAARAQGAGAPHLVPIEVPPERRQMIGLKFATVLERKLTDRIDATGIVEADEQRESYVQTRFPGWIRRVFANQNWQLVRRGQPLFTIYSPDLVNAENEYLIALGEHARVKNSTVEGVAGGAATLVASALERLRLFGVPAREIHRLERERTVRDAIEIDSPATGYIVDRAALPNMYADPSTRLYTIANLGTVWVYAAVFQDRLGEIKTGDAAAITVDSYPGRVFAGRIDYILPSIDSATRTARVRTVLANPDGALKLGMFVQVALTPRLGRALVIPAAGVLQTGTHNIVFTDRGDGYLDPVEVELGPRVGDNFIVRKGLHAGQRIVSSANFLIDSESQLQAAIGGYTPPPPGATQQAVAAEGHSAAPAATLAMTTAPSPPARGKNTVEVTLSDPTGAPIAGAKVRVIFYMPAMPSMGMAASRAEAILADRGGGKYAGAVTLSSGGTFIVTITAEKDGRTIATTQMSLAVSGPMAM